MPANQPSQDPWDAAAINNKRAFAHNDSNPNNGEIELHNWYNILKHPRPMTGIEHLRLIVDDIARDMKYLKHNLKYESILCKVDCSLPALNYCHVVGAAHNRPLNISRLSKRGWLALGSPETAPSALKMYEVQLQTYSTDTRSEFFFARTGVDIVGRRPTAFGVSAPAPLIDRVDRYGDDLKSAQVKQVRMLQDCYIELPLCIRTQFFHSDFNTSIERQKTAPQETV